MTCVCVCGHIPRTHPDFHHMWVGCEVWGVGCGVWGNIFDVIVFGSQSVAYCCTDIPTDK